MKVCKNYSRILGLWLTFIFVFFLISFGQASHSFARKSKSKKNKAFIEQKAAQDFCSKFLTEKVIMPRSVKIQGAPGLLLLKKEVKQAHKNYNAILERSRSKKSSRFVLPHELETGAKYAKILNKNNDSLLLVTGLDRRHIPGFDGIVINKFGYPLANVSLKTLLTGSQEWAAAEKVYEAAKQILDFSIAERWFLFAGVFIRDQNGFVRLNKNKLKRPRVAPKRTEWLKRALHLFGIEETVRDTRPARIIIDIQSEAPLPNEAAISEIKNFLRETDGAIESVVFLKEDLILEIKE